jgi:hypothetical protein
MNRLIPKRARAEAFGERLIVHAAEPVPEAPAGNVEIKVGISNLEPLISNPP